MYIEVISTDLNSHQGKNVNFIDFLLSTYQSWQNPVPLKIYFFDM